MANLIPLDEFANTLGISPEQVREMRERNEIQGYRDGSSWKFKETELERAKSVLAERSERSEGQEFRLSSDGKDDDSSGSMDSILIEETGVGEGESSSHIIGGDLSLGDDELTLVGSDINLGDDSSKQGRNLSEDTGSELNLAAKDEGSDILATETVVGSNLHQEDDDDELGLVTDTNEGSAKGLDGLISESDSDISLGDEARDPSGTGSEINLDLGEEESLDLGASGIGSSMGLAGDELGLDFDSSDSSDMDIDLAADDDDDLEIKSDKSSAAMELAADDDDSVELTNDSGEVEVVAGSGVNLADDDDMFADLEPASKSGVDDFMLTPVESGELEEDDSGSQVIALDNESVSSDSALFASDSGLEEDAFGGLEEDAGVVAEEEAVAVTPGRATAGAASVPEETPYTVINVLSLLATAGMILIAGLMVTDLMWNIWSFNEPYALNSTIMDQILSILGE